MARHTVQSVVESLDTFRYVAFRRHFLLALLILFIAIVIYLLHFGEDDRGYVLLPAEQETLYADEEVNINDIVNRVLALVPAGPQGPLGPAGADGDDGDDGDDGAAGSGGGTLGPIAFNDLTDGSTAGVVHGDVLYFDGTNWTNLAPGVAGQVLSTNGAGVAPSWVPAGGAGFWSRVGTDLSPTTAGDDVLLNAGETLTISDLTPGSVIFAGPAGLISEDNPQLFYNDTLDRLGLGTTTPSSRFEIEIPDSTYNVVGLLIDNNDATDNPVSLQIDNSSLGDGIEVNGTAGIGVQVNNTAGGTGFNYIGTTGVALASTKTAPGAWFTFDDGTDNFNFYNNAGSPETVIIADTGSLAVDTTNGDFYIKQDDSDATDWEQFVTTASNLWTRTGTNLSPTTAGDDVLLNAGETLTISDFTPGSVVFAGPGGLLSEDNANFFWNDATNRLGIGTAAPGALLEIDSSGALPLLIDNGASGELIRFDDGGLVTFGFYGSAASPETVITANTGSLAVDRTSGDLYIKQDDGDATDWERFVTSASALWTRTGTNLSPTTAGDDVLLNAGETLTISDFTPGSVVFAGPGGLLSEDNPNFFWDDTNNRLGLGTTTPNEQLELTGNMRMPATTATTGIIYRDGDTFIHNFGGTSSTYVGRNAGNLTNTGTNNAGFGLNALSSTTTGFSNVGLGPSALEDNDTGSRNTAVGDNAMTGNNSGSNNVAVGTNALTNNVSADANTALGTQALEDNTTGASNTAVGALALTNATTGSNNIALGRAAGDNLSTGSTNIFIGYEIDAPIATASDQMSIGNLLFAAGGFGTGTTIGAGNIGIATNSPDARLDVEDPENTELIRLSDSTNTDSVGFFTGDASPETVVSAQIGSMFFDSAAGIAYIKNSNDGGNTGWLALNTAASALWTRTGTNLSPTTAGDDVLLNAGETLTISDFTPGSVVFAGPGGLLSEDNPNFFWDDTNNRLGLGIAAPLEQLHMTGNLRMPATTATTGIIYSDASTFIHNFGTNNSFVGIGAGNLTMTGSNNTAFGDTALAANTTGTDNTALGFGAMNNNLTGVRNMAVGRNALFSLTSGNDNAAIGQGALNSVTTASGNIAIGRRAGDNLTTGGDNILIGTLNQFERSQQFLVTHCR